MEKQKKIALINDLTGFGRCSTAVMAPIVSAMNIQAVAVPTAILSAHTQFPTYYFDDYTDRMKDYIQTYKDLKLDFDAISTGFLGSEQQVDIVLDFIRHFKTDRNFVIVDPVMGDYGKLYRTYTKEMCDKMKELVRYADIITPNLTEALLLLYGEEGMKERMKALSDMEETQLLKEIEKYGRDLTQRFGLEAIVITGVEVSGSDGRARMGNLVLEKEKADWCFSVKEGGSYSGTGDLLASVLSAGVVRGIPMKACVEKAVEFLGGAIHDAVEEGTDRNDGVCFEKYLGILTQI